MVMIISTLYLLIAGFSVVAGTAIAMAAVGVAAPVVASGESAFDMVIDFLNALLEGVMVVVEAVADIFGSLFS